MPNKPMGKHARHPKRRLTARLLGGTQRVSKRVGKKARGSKGKAGFGV